MILILQLLNDPLDRFVNKDVMILETKFKSCISLDNYSDDWLIRKTIEELKKYPSILVVVVRNNGAELQNLSPLIHRLAQAKNVTIYYKGKPHKLILKMRNFSNMSITVFDKIEDLPPAL